MYACQQLGGAIRILLIDMKEKMYIIQFKKKKLYKITNKLL